MYGCEILFDREQAAAMQELIERKTGDPCPCKQGKACPLLPAGEVVTVGVPKMRRLASMPALLVTIAVAEQLLAHAA